MSGLTVDIERVVKTPATVRTRQVSAIFDVPITEEQRLHWHYELPDLRADDDWNVGLIVGPSGAGKTTLARELFPDELDPPLDWGASSVVDDFKKGLAMKDIGAACSAVGFNTIPAWMRPYEVLSNGEKFRVEMARRLIECETDMLVVDEFSSVVDRQVAKIASHAVQKTVRRRNMKFVAVTCHYDVLDWLQPDWVIDVPERSFTRRSVQPRPTIDAVVQAVPYDTWGIFAPYHYLTASLHRGARCYAILVDGRPVCFSGLVHRPHPKVKDIMGISRSVCLPDWQGIGLASVLTSTLGAAYKTIGKRVRSYPAAPGYIRHKMRQPDWKMMVAPGKAPIVGKTSGLRKQKPLQSEESDLRHRQATKWIQGSRPNAVFEFCGPAMDKDEAWQLLRYWHE